MESINGSLRRLRTDYVDLYQAHRYDTETPLDETMQAFADVVRAGKALYIGVSEWTAEQIRAGHALAAELEDPAGLQPAAVLDAVAGDRGRGRPDLPRAGPRPDRLVAGRPGRAHRQVPAGPAAARGIARHRRQGRCALHQAVPATTMCSPGCSSCGRSPTRPGCRLAQLAVAWVLQNDNVSAAIIGASRPEQVHENVKAAGVRLGPELLQRIDDVLAGTVVRDPGMTAQQSPSSRPC